MRALALFGFDMSGFSALPADGTAAATSFVERKKVLPEIE